MKHDVFEFVEKIIHAVSYNWF